jgi:hypothetical protein
MHKMNRSFLCRCYYLQKSKRIRLKRNTSVRLGGNWLIIIKRTSIPDRASLKKYTRFFILALPIPVKPNQFLTVVYSNYPVMAQYNIIYTSAAHEPYLWNGSGFDKLANTGLENLLYSGKPITDNELKSTLQKCRKALLSVFPDDAEPKLKTVEVGVITNKKK